MHEELSKIKLTEEQYNFIERASGYDKDTHYGVERVDGQIVLTELSGQVYAIGTPDNVLRYEHMSHGKISIYKEVLSFFNNHPNYHLFFYPDHSVSYCGGGSGGGGLSPNG